MTPEPRLQEACEQWHRLACAETEAILAHDWGRLASCQEALQQLQAEISSCLLELAKNSPNPSHTPAPAWGLRERVSQIIAIEQSNSALLQEARRAIQSKLNQFQSATRTLRRLRASYAPAPPPAWSSFS